MRRVFLTRAGPAVVCLVTLLIVQRPLGAWLADDLGNLALFRGESRTALRWFETGLQREPQWRLLHEDVGRAVLDADPARALAEFRIAGCGSACTAEQGDALLRMGRTDQAVDDFIAAKAVARVADRAQQLAQAGATEKAIALEETLVLRLHDNFFERAELASAYATLGQLQMRAASKPSVRRPALRRSAIASMRRAAALAPYNERYLLWYAFAEMQWGNRVAARTAFQRLLELHPHQPDAESALRQLRPAASTGSR